MYNTHRGMVPAPNSRLTELLDQLRQEFDSQSRSTGEFEHQCMCAQPRSLLLSDLPSQWQRGCLFSSYSIYVSPGSDRATPRSRNSLNCSLTDRRSYRAAPGARNDSPEGVSTGANPDQDEARVRSSLYPLPWLRSVDTNVSGAIDSYETEIRMLRHELESRGVQPVSHIAPTAHAGPQGQPPQVGHGPSNLFSGIMANPGGSGSGLVPPPAQDQPPTQHTLQQPASVAPQPPQSAFGGYPPGVGMCE